MILHQRQEEHLNEPHANEMFQNKVTRITGNEAHKLLITMKKKHNFKLYFDDNSSSYEHQEEVSYEKTSNDTEMENIEVDEPVVRRVVAVSRARVKHEVIEESTEQYYPGEYLDPVPVSTPKRKSPTKKQTLDGEIF